MNATKPTLFADAETASAVREARAVIALVGGYDGSGNYGDIAQLDAALGLVDRLGPGVLALPVLERDYLASHRELIESFESPPTHSLFFAPDGEPEDDLVPVGAPTALAFGATYLYGGGYLNRLWGARKVAMLDAAEELLGAGGAEPVCRLASGLQIEPEWAAEGNGSVLDRFELLGVRDSASKRALETLGSAAQLSETGDDAIGLLGRLPPADPPPTSDGGLHLNLHFAEHDWVSDQPRTLLDFYVGFVAEISRLTGRPVSAQPLVAYLDRRVDERPAAALLREACSARGVEVAEPLVLRPAALTSTAPRLRQASLTLSCSYHVAMTSLMLGVPAVLIDDNPYYEQKATGLRQDFGLPAAFGTASLDDPEGQAGEVASLLFSAGAAEKLRAALAVAADRRRRCRLAAEIDLLGRLGGAAASALEDRVGEQANRLARRSREPAELQVRIAALRTELEEVRPAGAGGPLDLERRAQEAEARADETQQALAAILQSRSWRLAAPLRRVGALLRRHQA